MISPNEDDENSIYLESFGIASFRGFGKDFQFISGLQKINVFIGVNNSGKSTILEAIIRYIGPMLGPNTHQKSPPRHQELDANLADPTQSPKFAFGHPVDRLIEKVSQNAHFSKSPGFLGKVAAAASLVSKDGYIWEQIGFPTPSTSIMVHSADPKKLIEIFDINDWEMMTRSRNLSSYVYNEQNIEAVFSSFLLNFAIMPHIPQIYYIPAFREILPARSSGEDRLNGHGLIKKLVELQNPRLAERDKNVDFEHINEFIGTITGVAGAKIEIPHTQDDILVHMDERILPISSLGTGIHQLIIIAAYCTIAKGSIICIEEPELNLHPALQKRLHLYLKTKTSNQYFIATHSAAFIDLAESSVYHIRMKNGLTEAEGIKTRNHSFLACADLGIRASDIVQANCIVWVEGPSDRIYVKHWIKAVEPQFEEGVHYSIMFYGGRLLSHLTADDQGISEFISLRNLNRNCAIIMDSDRKSNNASINSAKTRLKQEVERDGGLCWITFGREIENYISPELLESSISKLCGAKFLRMGVCGRFDHALHYIGNTTDGEEIVTIIDKVAIARLACESPADLAPYDLEKRVNDLVEMIRTANFV